MGNGCSIEVNIKTAGDGKVKKMVLGVNHGCTACEFSPAEYNSLDNIAAGTEMNRSYANTMEVIINVIVYFVQFCLLRFGKVLCCLTTQSGRVKTTFRPDVE